MNFLRINIILDPSNNLKILRDLQVKILSLEQLLQNLFPLTFDSPIVNTTYEETLCKEVTYHMILNWQVSFSCIQLILPNLRNKKSNIFQFLCLHVFHLRSTSRSRQFDFFNRMMCLILCSRWEREDPLLYMQGKVCHLKEVCLCHFSWFFQDG